MIIPSLRDLLLELGIGNFNATMIIRSMFMAPATTDPRSPPIMMMMRHIQRALYGMGAGVVESGLMDEQTADALTQLMGPGWLNRSWAEVVTAVVGAKRHGYRMSVVPVPPEAPAVDSEPSSMGLFDFLPDVPGGLLTYAVGGYLAYRYFSKKD